MAGMSRKAAIPRRFRTRTFDPDQTVTVNDSLTANG